MKKVMKTENWKLGLSLYLWRWLRPTLNLANNLIPLGLWQLQTMFWDGRICFKMLFLKILRLSGFRIFLSVLFHSITVEGNREFSKNVMSHFKRRNNFDVSCKVWSARQRNNIQQICRRLLAKDLIKVTEFSIKSSFFREILVLTLDKIFL